MYDYQVLDEHGDALVLETCTNYKCMVTVGELFDGHDEITEATVLLSPEQMRELAKQLISLASDIEEVERGEQQQH